MRRVFGALMVMALMCGRGFAVELPDSVGEWHSVSRHVQTLITEYNGESHGTVTYMTYVRESPSARVEVILTEGAGTGSLYVPENVRDSKGVMPADSGYERLNVGGHEAVLETVPGMAVALAVSVSGDAVLTAEGQGVGAGEIADFAGRMTQSLNIE